MKDSDIFKPELPGNWQEPHFLQILSDKIPKENTKAQDDHLIVKMFKNNDEGQGVEEEVSAPSLGEVDDGNRVDDSDEE